MKQIVIDELRRLANGGHPIEDFGICSTVKLVLFEHCQLDGVNYYWTEVEPWLVTTFLRLGLHAHYPIEGCEDGFAIPGRWAGFRGERRRTLCRQLFEHSGMLSDVEELS